MARVPAICPTCGLKFSSPIPMVENWIFEGNIAQCLRCGSDAPILDGYTKIINGMVAFIVSPAYSRQEKLLLIETAQAVGKQQITVSEAVNAVEAQSTEGGRLLREWLALGIAFASFMATTAFGVMDHMETRKNEFPEIIAAQLVEHILETETQPDLRPILTPEITAIPGFNPFIQNNLQDIERNRKTDIQPQTENRKARRARARKNLSKLRK
jgi:hypothetical protein